MRVVHVATLMVFHYKIWTYLIFDIMCPDMFGCEQAKWAVSFAFGEKCNYVSHGLLFVYFIDIGLIILKHSNRSFLDKLSVRKIPGIGRVCEALLKAFEIETVLQLRDQAAILPTLFSPVWCSASCLFVTKYNYLQAILIVNVFLFTQSSLEYFLRIALGLAETRHEVPDENEPAGANRKSMSCDRTFDSSMCEESGLLEQVRDICTSLAQQMQGRCLGGLNTTVLL